MAEFRDRQIPVSAYYDRYEPLILISVLWFLVKFLRFAFPPLFGAIQMEYGVSNTETGLLYSGLMISYAVMQFPGGAISDRIGRSATIAFGAFLFSAVSIGILFAVNFAVLFGLAALMGATTAAHKTVSINLISNTFPDETGFCLGVLDTVGQFGGVVAPITAVVLLGTLGWEWTFGVAGLVGIPLAAVYLLSASDDDRESAADVSTEDDEPEWSYLMILSNRRLLVFIIVSMTFTFALNGVSAFLPLYLSTEKGLSSGLTNGLYSAFFLVSVSQLATGRVSDSSSQLWVGVAIYAGMVLATGLLLAVGNTIVIGILTLLLGVTFHGFRPVRDSYLMTLIPNSIGGGSLGLIRTVVIIIGSSAPGTVGFVADRAGFTVAFGIVLGILIGGLILLGLLAATRSNEE